MRTDHPNREPKPLPPFHELLASLRQSAGLTQQQCATMAGAGLRTWSHWESGTRAMPLAVMELWCLALLAGGHLPPGKWVDGWVRKDFMRLFAK